MYILIHCFLGNSFELIYYNDAYPSCFCDISVSYQQVLSVFFFLNGHDLAFIRTYFAVQWLPSDTFLNLTNLSSMKNSTNHFKIFPVSFISNKCSDGSHCSPGTFLQFYSGVGFVWFSVAFNKNSTITIYLAYHSIQNLFVNWPVQWGNSQYNCRPIAHATGKLILQIFRPFGWNYFLFDWCTCIIMNNYVYAVIILCFAKRNILPLNIYLNIFFQERKGSSIEILIAISTQMYKFTFFKFKDCNKVLQMSKETVVITK